MNDAEAVLRCQDGDHEAFRHLVEQYQHVLYGTAYLMTGNASVAEEYVQDAFLAAWRGMNTFRIGRPMKPWLVRILVNTIVSQRRRGAITTTPLESEGDGSEPEDAFQMAECVENRHEVRRALAGLSEERRRVVMLRYFAGLSVSELAEVLGCREGTVKSRLSRALQELRTAMQG